MRMPWKPEQFVTVEGNRMHYRVRGSGPALMLIHGFVGHSFSWRHNLDALASEFRVYAPDLPGFGHSEPAPEYDYSFTAAARVILGFADTLGEGELLLAGHSMGGACCLLAAVTAPERVRALALLAPVHPFDRHLGWRIRLGATAFPGRAMLHAARPLTRLLTAFFLRYRLCARDVADEETVQGYAQPLRRESMVDVLQRTYAAWDFDGLQAALPRVRQPALLLWGDRDRIVLPASADRLAQALRAELRMLPNCGHLPAEECPEEVNRYLLEFLLSAVTVSA